MEIPSGRPDAAQLSTAGFRCYRRIFGAQQAIILFQGPPLCLSHIQASGFVGLLKFVLKSMGAYASLLMLKVCSNICHARSRTRIKALKATDELLRRLGLEGDVGDLGRLIGLSHRCIYRLPRHPFVYI